MSKIETLPLTEVDQNLIQAAKDIIAKRYKYGKHHIGAALLTKSGKIFTAVHLEANVGRIAVCAEAMVMGKAISEGESDFDTIVAVRHPHNGESNQEIKVASSCGMCRELIGDYAPKAKVIFSNKGEVQKCLVTELLPCKYVRE